MTKPPNSPPRLAGGSGERKALAHFYRDTLLNDVTPFWLVHGVDREHGGYLTCLNRDGCVLSGDKSVWFLGRMAWMFSRLYLAYGMREEWLEAARSGIGFMERHAFDTDGRMFFSLDREGRPLRKRRYLFSECFAIIAFAAYGKATNDAHYLQRANALLELVLRYRDTPGLLEPKVSPATRPMRGLALPMILLATAQELRRCGGDAELCQRVIDGALAELPLFVKPEFQCMLETVGPQGEFLDTLEGRCVNPGHSLEAGWFLLEEAEYRQDTSLREMALRIIDWSFDIGWDKEFGGLLYFRDARGLPCTEYWHDMKFWWPHNEGILAALSAWKATGDARYAVWHDKVAGWAFSHFADKEHGEWFGYLRRDGIVSTPVKGTLYKGFFHLPRMLTLAAEMLD